MKKFRILAVICLLIFIPYCVWYFSDRKVVTKTIPFYPVDSTTYGANNGQGNILAIQPFMESSDYASEPRFYTAIDKYLAQAQKKGWLSSKTIVALPEYLGTWLITADEKAAVYNSPSIAKAMPPIIFCHLFAFLKELPFASSKAKDIIKYSLFKVKAKTAAGIYQHVFSRLAKKYGVTIVAGSIVLPSPYIRQGQLKIGHGKLYNVSVVYQANGRAYEKISRKAFPTGMELPFTAKASPADLPVFQTPDGKIGVLICADAWYPSAYQTLKNQGVKIIVVPSYKTAAANLDSLWKGYDSYPAPPDVELSDIHKITAEAALLKYSLPGRILSSGATYGVIVFLYGKLWDLVSDGYTILVNHGKIIKGKRQPGATLMNFWLP